MIARGKGRIVDLVSGGPGNIFRTGQAMLPVRRQSRAIPSALNDATAGAGVLAFAVDPGLVRTSIAELQLFSEAGRTYLPDIQQLFDAGVNIPSSRAAALIAHIAGGRFDTLATSSDRKKKAKTP